MAITELHPRYPIRSMYLAPTHDEKFFPRAVASRLKRRIRTQMVKKELEKGSIPFNVPYLAVELRKNPNRLPLREKLEEAYDLLRTKKYIRNKAVSVGAAAVVAGAITWYVVHSR